MGLGNARHGLGQPLSRCLRTEIMSQRKWHDVRIDRARFQTNGDPLRQKKPLQNKQVAQRSCF